MNTGRWLVLLTLAAAAACYKTVVQPATPAETADRVTRDRGSVEGVVLRDGSVRKFPARARMNLEGDSLLLVRWRSLGGTTTDSVRLAEVEYVRVRQLHTGRTIAAVILIPAAIGIIIALLAEDEPPPPDTITSCPFVYVAEGEAYRAVAEPLGGAITAGLQRTDVSRLEGLTATDGLYRVLLGNEQQEVQYIDAFSLIAVDHPPGTGIIAGRDGSLHVTGPLLPPLRASDAAGEDLLPAVMAEDDRWWPPAAAGPLFPAARTRDTLGFAFPRPSRPAARLVVHARTSLLGAGTLKSMLDLWGSDVDYWYGMLDGSAPVRSAHEDWLQREELFVLRVWVLERNGWAAQELVLGGGPLISERQAVALDLSRVEGDTVQLSVRPARGFWELDLVALDTSDLGAVDAMALSAASATPLEGQDTRMLLGEADGRALVLGEPGQRVELTFRAPPLAAGQTRTVFGRTTGYYRILTDRSGSRQAARLDSLWLQPGFAVQLAERRYLERTARYSAR